MGNDNRKKLVLFGAGKIGRSFIAQLFSRGGFEVVFIDINEKIIEALNRQRSYKVVIKDINDKKLTVNNVRGVLSCNSEKVVEELVGSTIVAVSVGKSAIKHIIPLIAKGVIERYQKDNLPLDIIIAENMRNAGAYMLDELRKYLPVDYPVNKMIGLVESSIGKMVPIMPQEEIEKDILQVYAEPYNTLILDKKAFKNSVPEIEGLALKNNMAAWMDRKLFIHNLGHAAAAYYGFYKCPDKKYIYEVLDNVEVRFFTLIVMEQAAEVLLREYPEEFTMADLLCHIEDLVTRFRNKALGDTVFRVGSDLQRKLGKDDRVVGAIRLAQKNGCNYEKFLEVLVYGLQFRATNEMNQMFPGDIDIASLLDKNITDVLTNICGFNLYTDEKMIETINNLYNSVCEEVVCK